MATRPNGGGAKLAGKPSIVVDVVSDPNWFWAWPAKRRIEKVIHSDAFKGRADFTIRFQPFQLYPHLPRGDEGDTGVEKDLFFATNRGKRDEYLEDPQEFLKQRQQRVAGLNRAWEAEGLKEPFPNRLLALSGEQKRWGNSFDAQRLIFLARQQGREDSMIEEVYKANHEDDRALSDWSVLIPAAERAGVTGAEEMLRSDRGMREVRAKIDSYIRMGINAVPVIIVQEKHIISNGCPEPELFADVFNKLITSHAAGG